MCIEAAFGEFHGSFFCDATGLFHPFFHLNFRWCLSFSQCFSRDHCRCLLLPLISGSPVFVRHASVVFDEWGEPDFQVPQECRKWHKIHSPNRISCWCSSCNNFVKNLVCRMQMFRSRVQLTREDQACCCLINKGIYFAFLPLGTIFPSSTASLWNTFKYARWLRSMDKNE